MRTTAFALTAAIALTLSVASQAQEIRRPQASPAAKAGMTVGVTDVEIVYHRPGVKGREVWGKLVPYGEVWRLGANEATTISFSTPVKVEGKDVPAGTYSLFAIPAKDKWTLILNKKAEQWGAYSYKQEDDLVRFDVKPRTGPAVEWMDFDITPASADSAVVEMAWETLRVPFTISTDADRLVWSGIDKTLAGTPDSDAYLTAALYALEKGTRLDEAMGWVDKSLAMGESFWNHEAKAKLLLRQGKVDEALQHIDKAIALAKGKAPQGYINGLEELKVSWKAPK